MPLGRYSCLSAARRTAVLRASFGRRFVSRSAVHHPGGRVLRVTDPRQDENAGSLPAEESRAVRLRGVWDVWNGPTAKLFTVAIVTTTPNELTCEFHDRMPVILSPDDEAPWLDPAIVDTAKLTGMLRRYAADETEAVQVNAAMNKPRADCLTPKLRQSRPLGLLEVGRRGGPTACPSVVSLISRGLVALKGSGSGLVGT